jgi:hypothetical protein
MRKIHLLAFVVLVAATATVAGASSRDRHRDRDRSRDHHEYEHEHDRRSRGSDDGRRLRAAGPIDATYAKECGACHLAYPPGLLSPEAWRAIMSGLDRHFGQNAELDDTTRAQLEGWIVERAGPAARSGRDASLRVTEQPWFVDEHREVARRAGESPAIRIMANCAACHPGAESWDFDDDRLRVPR